MKLIIVFLTLTLANNLFSQNLYTKDNVDIGERSVFIETCITGANQRFINVNGIEIDAYSYCSCMGDNLIPSITSTELMDAIQNNKVAELVTNETNFGILMNCVENNIELKDDYKFNDAPLNDITQKVAITVCVQEILSDPENLEFWTPELANQYCDCAISKIYALGYTYKDILELELEDGASFNEIVVPCINDIVSLFDALDFSNTYIPSDIIGSKTSSKVELTDYLGQGYKVKISMNGVTKYYLLDTGASDLIINEEVERELIKNGTIKDGSYVGFNTYAMANNEEIEARVVLVDNIKIGDYTLNNVYVAIIDNGALLCGTGLLDKFKKWEVNKENKLLILYK